jgi:methionyl-tRNA formyltransferase
MSKKIVFMGTPEFSVPTLEVLHKSSYKIECAYSQPPKKSLRGQKINSSPVQITSERLGIKVRNPLDLNSNEEYEYFKSLKPHLVIVVAYGKIIPKKYLSLSEKGFLNIHASLLPKWRGAAPIQRSIMNRDRTTGISFMKIEEDLDEGPFCKQIEVNIEEQTTTGQLTKKLSILGSKNIIDCVDDISKDKVKFITQDHSKATYSKKITKEESKINWKKPANEIIAKINGLNPSPGAWFNLDGVRCKVWKAATSNLTGREGEIIGDDLIIACKEQSIKVLEIQREGKKKMKISDFLSGTKIKKGTILI